MNASLMFDAERWKIVAHRLMTAGTIAPKDGVWLLAVVEDLRDEVAALRKDIADVIADQHATKRERAATQSALEVSPHPTQGDQ